ncbi:hypothetical protein RhoFasGS6_05121 [Rhodococcus fascians]|nr:hypothetical protein [Rhodococcus fascians]
MIDQGRQRVSGRSGHQVVIVDNDEHLGPVPPRPLAELLLGDVRSRHAPAHSACEIGDHRRQRRLRGRIAGQMLGIDCAQESSTVVRHDQFHPIGWVRIDQRSTDPPQQGRLPAFAVAEDDEMWVLGEVDRHRSQLGLVDADRNPQFRNGAAVAGPGAGESIEHLRPFEHLRQHADRRGRRPRGRCGDRADGLCDSSGQVGHRSTVVDPRQCDLQVQTVLGHAPARSALRHTGGFRSADVRVRRISESQLEPGPDQILRRGPHFCPARGRQNEVQTECQSLGRQRRDLLFETLEVGSDGLPSVDHQEDVAEPVVLIDRLHRPQPPELDHGIDAAISKSLLALTNDSRDLGHGPAHSVDVQSVGHRSDVR